MNGIERMKFAWITIAIIALKSFGFVVFCGYACFLLPFFFFLLVFQKYVSERAKYTLSQEHRSDRHIETQFEINRRRKKKKKQNTSI